MGHVCDGGSGAVGFCRVAVLRLLLLDAETAAVAWAIVVAAVKKGIREWLLFNWCDCEAVVEGEKGNWWRWIECGEREIGSLRQDIAVLRAEAAIVIGSTGSKLGLRGGETGVEDAVKTCELDFIDQLEE